MNTYINLSVPSHSYMVGFIYGDGHLSHNQNGNRKGRLSIEIGQQDVAVLEVFKKLIPVHSSIRTRDRVTNFGDRNRGDYEHHSAVLTVNDLAFRQELNEIGIPFGKKSETISPPNFPFKEQDFWRGFIDSDGSLGLTKDGLPFISLVTQSEKMAQAYLSMVNKLTGRQYTASRNKRDNVFNIMVMREAAQQVISYLYYPECLALPRKLDKAREALTWKRPANMRKMPLEHKWTDDENQVALKNTPKEAAKILGLTRQICNNRKAFLKKKLREQQ